MKKIILKNEKAVQALLRGIEEVAQIIFPTIGPLGRNQIINGEITNDGEVIANNISLDDETEDMGALRMKKVANKTTALSGDGRKTTMAIFYSLVSNGIKYVDANVDTLELREGILAASRDIGDAIDAMATPIKTKEQLEIVATISSQHKEIGRVVGELIYEIGKDGYVTIESSAELGIKSEKALGIEFDQGILSPYMITNRSNLTAEIDHAYIMLCDYKITNINDLLPAMELLVKGKNKNQFVVIAEDFDPIVLNFVNDAIVQGGVRIICIKTPGYSNKIDMLNDIAIVTGGKVVQQFGQPLTLESFGQAEKLIASQRKTTIIKGKGRQPDINQYIAELTAQREATEGYAKELMDKRIARLSGGIAIVKIGAQSDADLTYLRKKVADAINATKNASLGGVVVGGGIALIRAATQLSKPKNRSEEFAMGYSLVMKAVGFPFKLMMKNANREASIAFTKIMENKSMTYGYDIKKDVFGDMTKIGIMDAAISSKIAVQNSCAEAAIFLTIGGSIADKLEDKDL